MIRQLSFWLVLICIVAVITAKCAHAFMLLGAHGTAPPGTCGVVITQNVVVTENTVIQCPVTGSCSNLLDFSASCNSQYMAIPIP